MKIIKETLDNGLTVILAPMAAAKTITGIFAVRAGWKYETKENNGIAHFLEHMAFKGTHKRPTTLDICKEIEGRGGAMNAFTSEEMTVYYIKMPYQFEVPVIDVISDMLLNSKLDEEEIKRESGTIIQELRMYEDNPQYYVGMIAWPELLYGDQPAGRCCVGTEESLKGLNRKYFVDFMENLYVSENAIFCLAGRIKNIDKTLGNISALFSGIRNGGPKITKPSVIENQKEPNLLLVHKDIQQSHIILGVRSYNIFHPKRDVLEILATILGGNMSSRMFIEVREKRGLAYYVGTGLDLQSDAGCFFTSAGLDREKVFLGIRTMMDEYRKICEERVSEEELKRAKDFIIGSEQMYMESTSAVARDLAGQWVKKNGEIIFEKEWKKNVQAVTAEDIQSVAQEIFVNKGLNLAIVGPHQGMEDEFLKILKF